MVITLAQMLRITIPPQHRKALASVAEMSQEAFDEIFAILRDASPSATIKQFLRLIPLFYKRAA